MKRMWVSLLVALVFIPLVLTGAVAETNDAVEAFIETSAPVGPEDEIMLEDFDDLPQDAELPEIDGIPRDSLEMNVDADAFPAGNAVANDSNPEDFEIFYDTLVKYNGPGGAVVIPDGITFIQADAFRDCTNVTSVTLGDSVTSIDSFAFFNCTGLTSIAIPDSVTSIGSYAFYGCTGLTSIAIPDSVTSIEWGTFECTGLTSIAIPDSVTWIGGNAFAYCSDLTSVTFGNSVESIITLAFDHCTSLTSVTLPASVSYIDYNAFCSCTSLSSVAILNGKARIDDAAFYDCPALTVFHTPCISPATKWAEEKGYSVVRSDHIPVDDPAVEPTCTQTGLTEGSHCSNCGEIFSAQQPIPAKGHSAVTDPAVPATCAKTGLTEGAHCSVCGEVLVRQETVPKLISLKKCAVTGIKDAVYTGKAIQPAPVVKYNGKKLAKGTDYTVRYSNNKAIGTATVTITGKGRCAESVKKTFRINPRAVALSSLTPGARQLTVKWRKGTGVTGYELQYGLKKNFSGAKTVVIKKAGTVKTVLKNLTPNKTCYVRIRAYKAAGGKKYYSAWSRAKSAKPKK